MKVSKEKSSYNIKYLKGQSYIIMIAIDIFVDILISIHQHLNPKELKLLKIIVAHFTASFSPFCVSSQKIASLFAFKQL